MYVSTIAADGRTTIPRRLRDQLGIGRGARMAWHVMPGGTLLVRPKIHSVLDLKGSLKSPKKKPVPIEEMNAWRSK